MTLGFTSSWESTVGMCFYADQKAELANADIALDYWAYVEADDGFVESLIGEVRSDVFRALGLPPGVLAASA